MTYDTATEADGRYEAIRDRARALMQSWEDEDR